LHGTVWRHALAVPVIMSEAAWQGPSIYHCGALRHRWLVVVCVAAASDNRPQQSALIQYNGTRTLRAEPISGLCSMAWAISEHGISTTAQD
jgi:hypothetical protein